jgi:hypothetical protein
VLFVSKKSSGQTSTDDPKLRDSSSHGQLAGDLDGRRVHTNDRVGVFRYKNIDHQQSGEKQNNAMFSDSSI